MRLRPTIGIINRDKLHEEFDAAFGIVPFAVRHGYDGANFVEAPDEVTLEQVQTIVNAHDPAILTPAQQKEAAQQILLANAKIYLSAQLAAPNPNITTIYNTVKAHVDSSPLLQQMVTNQITICSNSLTWVLNLLTPTALDRQRYLLCVQLVISTID